MLTVVSCGGLRRFAKAVFKGGGYGFNRNVDKKNVWQCKNMSSEMRALMHSLCIAMPGKAISRLQNARNWLGGRGLPGLAATP